MRGSAPVWIHLKAIQLHKNIFIEDKASLKTHEQESFVCLWRIVLKLEFSSSDLESPMKSQKTVKIIDVVLSSLKMQTQPWTPEAMKINHLHVLYETSQGM